MPPVVVTGVAMLWVGWLGRARDVSPDRSEAAQERFAAAILRELPERGHRPGPLAETLARPQHRHRRAPLAGARVPIDDTRRTA